MKMKPLNKFYFVKAKNSGEQFFMFVSICAWLIRETGKSFEQPQEFDDPNVLISKIIKALNDMVRSFNISITYNDSKNEPFLE
jgi:estrogen-related receptor beta like 1